MFSENIQLKDWFCDSLFIIYPNCIYIEYKHWRLLLDEPLEHFVVCEKNTKGGKTVGYRDG